MTPGRTRAWIGPVTGIEVDTDAPDPGPRLFKLTDLGNAERLAHHEGVDMRYCYEWESWMIWTGRRWERDPAASTEKASLVVRRIMDEFELLGDPNDEAEKAWRKHANASESRRSILSMIDLARPMLRVRSIEFDTNPNLLNVLNGTLDLHTGELRPHRRADLCSKLAPVAFDRDATCPRWDAFITWATCNDGELLDYLQRFFGYALTGDTSEQVFQVWHGGGANGKGTAIRVLMALLGDYAMAGAPGLLMSRYGETHPTEVAAIQGARLVVCQEIDEGKRLDEARIKQLTGEDRVTARFMHSDFFQFEVMAKFLLVVNARPVVTGTDHGIWRRLHLLPWDATVTDAALDRYLATALIEELPGILAWAVRGCVSWRTQRLGRPARMTAATSAYRQEQDQIGLFLDECCTVAVGVSSISETAAALYRAYASWGKERGEHPCAQKRFGMELEKRSFVSGKNSQGQRSWRGVCLRLGNPVA